MAGGEYVALEHMESKLSNRLEKCERSYSCILHLMRTRDGNILKLSPQDTVSPRILGARILGPRILGPPQDTVPPAVA